MENVEHMCKKCGETKPWTREFFYPLRKRGPDAFQYQCIVCMKKRTSDWYKANTERAKATGRRAYYATHEEHIAASAAWRAANPLRNKKMKKRWYERHIEHATKKAVAWNKNNTEQRRSNVNAWTMGRYANSQQYRLYEKNLKHLRAFLLGRVAKDYSWLVGCSLEELRKHFEERFTEGQSWGTYGLSGWTIDHIVPCSSFDLANKEELLKCFHFTNLQPLKHTENCKKRNK